jgi:hypothetical protein
MSALPQSACREGSYRIRKVRYKGHYSLVSAPVHKLIPTLSISVAFRKTYAYRLCALATKVRRRCSNADMVDSHASGILKMDAGKAYDNEVAKQAEKWAKTGRTLVFRNLY